MGPSIPPHMPSSPRPREPRADSPLIPALNVHLDAALTRVSYSVVVIVFLLVLGASFVHFVEGWRWLDSFYFATETMTTVGYGDFAPTHDATKLFLIFYMFAGISVALYALTNLGRHYIERREPAFHAQVHRLRSVGRAAQEHARAHLRRIPPPPTAHR